MQPLFNRGTPAEDPQQSGSAATPMSGGGHHSPARVHPRPLPKNTPRELRRGILRNNARFHMDMAIAFLSQLSDESSDDDNNTTVRAPGVGSAATTTGGGAEVTEPIRGNKGQDGQAIPDSDMSPDFHLDSTPEQHGQNTQEIEVPSHGDGGKPSNGAAIGLHQSARGPEPGERGSKAKDPSASASALAPRASGRQRSRTPGVHVHKKPAAAAAARTPETEESILVPVESSTGNMVVVAASVHNVETG